MAAPFDLQGHRGARGYRPENTLPSFETALDQGVVSLETDLHLTRDGVLVLSHDPVLTDRLCRLIHGRQGAEPSGQLLSTMTMAQLRAYRADRNPDTARVPEQEAIVTPLTGWFAGQRGIDPYALPTLAELFDFCVCYAGQPGEEAGKTPGQREQAGKVSFALELKRVPFHPEFIGDTFDGERPGLFEERVVEAVQSAGVVERTVVRSFDHRSVRAIRRLQPEMRTAILVARFAPAAPADLARQAGATTYCPQWEFVDKAQVRQLHDAGMRVVPWTVNDPAVFTRLLDWGVDGVSTDYPDRLAAVLRSRVK
jgi:glycerophosphoryl diester phosphodiesterase